MQGGDARRVQMVHKGVGDEADFLIYYKLTVYGRKLQMV